MAEIKNDSVVAEETNAGDKENEVQLVDAQKAIVEDRVKVEPQQIDARITDAPMETDQMGSAPANEGELIKDTATIGNDNKEEYEMTTLVPPETKVDEGYEQTQHEQVVDKPLTPPAIEPVTTVVESESIVIESVTVVEKKVEDNQVIESVSGEMSVVADTSVFVDQQMGDDSNDDAPQAKIAKVMSPMLATVAKDADAAAVVDDHIQPLTGHIASTRSYLDQTLVPILLEGLAAAARTRPADPIAFVAEYLMMNKERYNKLMSADIQKVMQQ